MHETSQASTIVSLFSEGDCVLVVVDMQMEFSAALAPWLLDAVEAEIEKARKASWAIVALELFTFEPLHFYGNTHVRLIKAVQPRKENAQDPPRFFMRAKSSMDGTSRVIDVCEKQGFAPKRFRVCGVKSRHCVQATALGLAHAFPDSLIEVVKAACNQDLPHDWSTFPVVENLRLV